LWVVPAGVIGFGVLALTIGIIAGSGIAIKLASVIAVIGLGALVLRVKSAASVPEGKGEFGPTYFTPVDLVGLYWHIVDLIWIFLFPLLYLIH
jgi:hypothetical protein